VGCGHLEAHPQAERQAEYDTHRAYAPLPAIHGSPKLN
jgi:hypothetical protein